VEVIKKKEPELILNPFEEEIMKIASKKIREQ